MKIRGREYSDYEEYLDERQEYKLDAMKEGWWEKKLERDLEQEEDRKLEGELEEVESEEEE